MKDGDRFVRQVQLRNKFRAEVLNLLQLQRGHELMKNTRPLERLELTDFGRN